MLFWSSIDAVAYLKKNAASHSLGECARYVREAIEAGGVTLVRHKSAKDYGPSLTRIGFQAIPAGLQSIHQAGDVGIVQPISGHPNGHMAMFGGVHWISDFVQWHGLYPGPSYRAAKPPFTIYRYPIVWAGPDKATLGHSIA